MSAAQTGSLTLERALPVRTRSLPDRACCSRADKCINCGRQRREIHVLAEVRFFWQSNLGTANNIFGQVLPQSVIPAMSGPVLPGASAGSVWGSATAGLFSWEPFDFGLRQAT